MIEVLVALLVFEIAVVGIVGTLVLASSTLTRAETLERAVATAEGVLDSLAHVDVVVTDSVKLPTARVTWTVDESGRIRLRATDDADRLMFELESVVAP